jgi:dipeptidyl aminopeptidase/acylaminoacyl peptidase
MVALLVAGLAACGSSQTEPTPTVGQTQQPTNDQTTPLDKQAKQQVPVEAKGNPSNDLIPRTVLFGNPDKASPQISPDGKHLSWLADSGGELNVFVAPVGKLDQAKPVTADKKRPVRRYFWAYTNKHIVYLQDSGGDENWHVFVTDIESGETKDLTPKEKIQARIEAVSYKHPDEVVIGMNDRNPQLHDLYKVNLKTGKMELLQENPGFVGFSIDHDYKVRLGVTMTPDGGMLIMKKAKKAKKAKKGDKPNPMAGWEEFTKIAQEDTLNTSPITFGRRNRYLYMWDSRGRNTSALTRVDTRTGKSKVIASSEKADGSGIQLHPTKKTVLAVAFTHARQEWKVLDRSVKKDYAKLAKISDGDPNVVDTTLDNNTWIVAYNDDDGPVKWYLYDRKKKQESFLFTNRKALEEVKLAKMHPRLLKSRDGLELVNYLSLPPESDPDGDGKPSAALPTVMLIHGGPWSRDSWGYNTLHQMLADRGYAVMSVNYRGSTGFGKAFINAGNMEWAGKMHDDVIDSVNWLVEQGIADKSKVCIAGGSYGGYATLVGLTFTPDVFACGVDIVGPSNIVTLLEAIPPYWKPMQNIFKTRVGDWTTPEGKKMLIERSPLTHVDKIEKPLLIGQGANDPRVKQAESDQIVSAMKAKGIPVSYVLFPDEGHGFQRKPNRLAFFAAMEAFLSAHIGGQYQPATAEELAGTTVKVPEGLYGIPGFASVVKGLQ